MNSENISNLAGILSLIFSVGGWIIYLSLIYSKKISGSTWGWLTNAVTNAGFALAQISTEQMMVALMFTLTAFFSIIAALCSNGWKTRKIKDWYKMFPSCGFISLSLLNPIYSIIALGANTFWVNWLFISDIKSGCSKEQPIVWSLWSTSAIMALICASIEVNNGAHWYGLILPILVVMWVNIIALNVYIIHKKQKTFGIPVLAGLTSP